MKIKVVFIITGLSVGGAETMLYKLLANLNRRLFTPIVISLGTTGEFGPRIAALGIDVHALGMRKTYPDPIVFLRLIIFLRKIKPDLVHTWMYHADLFGGLAARVAGVKNVVWCIRNSDLSRESTSFATALVMRVCSLLSNIVPSWIVSCSVRAQAIHVSAGYRKDRFVIIPNGFDVSQFTPNAGARISVRAELGFLPDVKLVGLIARKDPQKNHIGFIRAAGIVRRFYPDVCFVLAGSGVVFDDIDLAENINESGLVGHVRLLGRRDDVPRLMASLDVLVSASSFGEAFPNVLGEAMASGVVCAATDVGDCAEIIGDTGLVVAEGDMQALSRVILELLNLPEEARRGLGLRARARVESMYEIKKIVGAYESFYVRCIGRGA